MCLGSGARAANKAAMRQYQYELDVRKRNWMDTLAVTSVERVQYEQGLDASNVGLQNFYGEMQSKYGDLVGQAMQADEENWKSFLQQGQGEKLAAAGRTGRSARRISSLEFGQYMAKSSRAGYMLTQARREMSKASAKQAAATRAQQMQMFAQNSIIKSPDLAPPRPVLQNVGQASFMDALSIAGSIAGIAGSFGSLGAKPFAPPTGNNFDFQGLAGRNNPLFNLN